MVEAPRWLDAAGAAAHLSLTELCGYAEEEADADQHYQPGPRAGVRLISTTAPTISKSAPRAAIRR